MFGRGASKEAGQLKLAFDRLFAVAECGPDLANPQKESVLLMAAEGHGFEETLEHPRSALRFALTKTTGEKPRRTTGPPRLFAVPGLSGSEGRARGGYAR